MAVSVRLDGIEKRFGKKGRELVAVRDLSVEIGEREFFTFVGPSGCGKTTTLRMIAGLETPTAGRIYFGDVDVTDLPPQKRDIAMVFQDIALFPYMTVAENIGYALRVAGLARARIAEKVERAAATLELSDKLGMKPAQLSGGQQQRVAIGRAIVKEPRVLLMDEPLSALDARLRAEMRTEILRLHRAISSTIVYVTHDQVEAMTMSTRLAVVDRGSVLQVDSPRTVFRHPRNLTVATFIGTPAMNVLPAAIVTAGDGLAVELLGCRLPVHPRHHAALQGLKQVEAGLRPQALRLAAPTPDGIRGRIFLRQPLGLEDEILLHAADGTPVKLVSGSGQDFAEGDQVGLEFALRDLYLFHSDSRETLCEGIDGGTTGHDRNALVGPRSVSS